MPYGTFLNFTPESCEIQYENCIMPISGGLPFSSGCVTPLKKTDTTCRATAPARSRRDCTMQELNNVRV